MPDWLLQIVSMVFAAGVTWGAIRGDIKALHEQVRQAAQEAGEAHKRIDAILLRGQHG